MPVIKKNSGFTLIEIVVVTVIFITLMGISSVNLLSARDTTSIENEVNVLVNDIKAQQNQAMVGATSGDTPSEYGIYFETTQYTLFKGTSYSAADPLNHTITLDPSLSFSSIDLPSQTLTFERGSGEVNGYDPAQNSLTITSSTGGNTITIEINQYGVITNLN